MTRPARSYHGYRFPPEIISHAVWLYYRFCLSFRDVEDLLAERGVTVSYEAIRHWCQTFGLDYARRLRRGRGRMGDTWYLDELFVTRQGRRHDLWRAVDQDGDVIDILVQSRRDRRAAARFFRTLLKGQGRAPRRLVTDKLRSYSAAHRMPWCMAPGSGSHSRGAPDSGASMSSFKRSQAKYVKQTHKIANWPAYDQALVTRGSLTFWFTDEAISKWTAPPSGKAGGQRKYSNLAIETALAFRMVDAFGARLIEGTSGAQYPVFSPRSSPVAPGNTIVLSGPHVLPSPKTGASLTSSGTPPVTDTR